MHSVRKVYAAAQIMLWIEHAEDKKQSALISVGNISKNTSMTIYMTQSHQTHRVNNACLTSTVLFLATQYPLDVSGLGGGGGVFGVNVVAVLAFFSYVLIVVEVRRITGFLLGRYEVLRRLRHYLRAQSLRHHTIDRLEEADFERGSARRSSLKGQG